MLTKCLTLLVKKVIAFLVEPGYLISFSRDKIGPKMGVCQHAISLFLSLQDAGW